MKKLISILVIITFTTELFSQEKMIVNNDVIGSSSYRNSAESIYSMSKLPPFIVSDIDSLFKKTLGIFSVNVKFYSGQIVDLKNYFSEKGSAPKYDMKWIVPKYDLDFILRDTSIGIKSYPIKIRLDDYGQLIKITWPRQGYTNKSRFVKREIIRDAAFKKADSLKFNLENAKVGFRYDEDSDKLLWQFLFPKENENSNVKEYDLIEINWGNVNDFTISKLVKVTVY
ncbi:MAG TPA: hypothetical protein VK668_21460 [Mucilaginibacter sp.]|nr:hypothetical protein [Mucilaginibacter sp.]